MAPKFPKNNFFRNDFVNLLVGALFELVDQIRLVFGFLGYPTLGPRELGSGPFELGPPERRSCGRLCACDQPVPRFEPGTFRSNTRMQMAL